MNELYRVAYESDFMGICHAGTFSSKESAMRSDYYKDLSKKYKKVWVEKL